MYREDGQGAGLLMELEETVKKCVLGCIAIESSGTGIV